MVRHAWSTAVNWAVPVAAHDRPGSVRRRAVTNGTRA
jgi:hypothetical protein